jgi:putative transposase
MTEILALLQTIAPLLSKTTLRQLGQVIFGMLAASGRITMLGLSRWTEKGGSYRTIQRFYSSELPWKAIHWLFVRLKFLKPTSQYFLAGDEVVDSKAGRETYGLDRFFSSIQQRVISGLAFFTFSLVDVEAERSYPLQMTQVVRSLEEKAASKVKKEAKKAAAKTSEKRKRGRPKGSKNQSKKEVVLNPELLRIQTALKSLLETIGKYLSLVYVVMDGHFGNYPSAYMVRETGLHLISKMRSDAALYFPFSGDLHKKRGPKPKQGDKIDVRALPDKYLKETTTEDGLRTEFYQGQFVNREFEFPLNVVIVVKINLNTSARAHVILFSTDLEQTYDQIIKFYSLRFQIEFNFRDAKQFWGLEDFMNVKETAVTNAANLSLFMVNFSSALAEPFRKQNPDFSILDLKSQYRGYRYATETIKMLPEKPDGILLAEIFQQIARLGAIHPVFQPVSSL